MKAPIIYFTKNKNLKHTSIDELKKNIPEDFELEYEIPEADIIWAKCVPNNSGVAPYQYDIKQVISQPIFNMKLFEIISENETLIHFKTTKGICKSLFRKYHSAQVIHSGYTLFHIDMGGNIGVLYDCMPDKITNHLNIIRKFENKLGVQYYDLDSDIMYSIGELIIDIASSGASDDKVIEFIALRNIYGEYHF